MNISKMKPDGRVRQMKLLRNGLVLEAMTYQSHDVRFACGQSTTRIQLGNTLARARWHNSPRQGRTREQGLRLANGKSIVPVQNALLPTPLSPSAAPRAMLQYNTTPKRARPGRFSRIHRSSGLTRSPVLHPNSCRDASNGCYPIEWRALAPSTSNLCATYAEFRFAGSSPFARP